MAKATVLVFSDMEGREGMARGLTLLAEYDQHPSVRRLLTEGRDVITF